MPLKRSNYLTELMKPKSPALSLSYMDTYNLTTVLPKYRVTMNSKFIGTVTNGLSMWTDPFGAKTKHAVTVASMNAPECLSTSFI